MVFGENQMNFFVLIANRKAWLFQPQKPNRKAVCTVAKIVDFGFVKTWD